MANRRVLVRRRNSTRNIRKITRTMQLIATARFQAAFNRATASRPYTDKLAQLIEGLARAATGLDHPLMETHEDVPHEALLVLTSDRGLCGGYNANVLRTVVEHLDSRAEAGIETAVTMVGKKGTNYFRFRQREVAEVVSDIGDKPRFEQVEPVANRLMEAFIRGEIAALHVGYMKFASAGKQMPVVERLLPLSYEAPEGEDTAGEVLYEFSPSPQELLDELLPASVRVRLFQAFTDAAVSEQVARMVAMKAATDAAEDMIKRLTMQYNRARQTQVTMELLDIVGGANALA
ncbi:MAG: ATP synthase F1 subunit gamma [Acidobacteria bacterium]|nr:ATP synthase F1 subunit gamma [Acidobacteriota bacterium]